jgi:NADH-quinone oxidoreductase subunit C
MSGDMKKNPEETTEKIGTAGAEGTAGTEPVSSETDKAPTGAAEAGGKPAEGAQAAAPKAAAAETGGQAPPRPRLTEEEREARRKAALEAKAAREAAKAAGGEGGTADGEAAPRPRLTEEEREARRKAALEAKAARAAGAAGAAKKADDAEPAAPKPPSPNQPRLDRMVELIKQHVAEDAVEEAYINEVDRHLPVIVVKAEHWAAVAKMLKEHAELKFNYLRNLSGVDQETHMEVVYHLLCLDTKREVCIKVKTDRDQPSIPSVTPVWLTADWPEREAYDLLGIQFPGHPNLKRILLTDDWVGHPLRKDYVPIDPEV